MSTFGLFRIYVPKEVKYNDKMINTLTKTFNISKRKGEQAIRLLPRKQLSIPIIRVNVNKPIQNPQKLINTLEKQIDVAEKDIDKLEDKVKQKEETKKEETKKEETKKEEPKKVYNEKNWQQHPELQEFTEKYQEWRQKVQKLKDNVGDRKSKGYRTRVRNADIAESEFWEWVEYPGEYGAKVLDLLKRKEIIVYDTVVRHLRLPINEIPKEQLVI